MLGGKGIQDFQGDFRHGQACMVQNEYYLDDGRPRLMPHHTYIETRILSMARSYGEAGHLTELPDVLPSPELYLDMLFPMQRLSAVRSRP